MKYNVYLVLLLSVSGQLQLFLLYFTVKCLFWETVGSLSVTCWSSISGLSVACRPTDDQQSVEGSSSSQKRAAKRTVAKQHVNRSLVDSSLYQSKKCSNGQSVFLKGVIMIIIIIKRFLMRI